MENGIMTFSIPTSRLMRKVRQLKIRFKYHQFSLPTMEFDDFDLEDSNVVMRKVKCKYCGRYFELSEEIQLNPDTGEYEYICPNCAKRFLKEDT
jgi:uncharacterized Zn-finger protein